ncbi:Carnitine O-acyltransferase CPT2/YAT1 [Phaffia rhodozyma]|uniref:Carnitine O-acyltransferase CPT2/YAT1 n=1 Tax=Phaffia rhodozyma TaxID=264483 RepID=A0A0F7SN42_PHARH|nr:Carnitine O-acyltransferase CPT2/YAT1 [Phaffia rhodozyma]
MTNLVPPPPSFYDESSITFKAQKTLSRLPVPSLEDSMKRYLNALLGLQDAREHEQTKQVVAEFLSNPTQGPRLQEKLMQYNEGVSSYIEEFWYESYLNQSESVVLSLNPFFVLEDDPTPSRGSQLARASSLIISSLGFIHDLRAGTLQPDAVRGTSLDMSQYTRLFGTSRIPTNRGCKMVTNEESRHIVVIRRGQFYWFDVLDRENRPLFTERDVMLNLEAICKDADILPIRDVATSSVGVLSTENRKMTLVLYDKLQIIVCANGEAGINFEHTGVDGHTVLRYAADVYTELVLLFAKSINPSAPTLFKSSLSPHSKSFKNKQTKFKPPPSPVSGTATNGCQEEEEEDYEVVPKKLTWHLTREIRTGIRFAETRLSDLICQNDIEALEFSGYGKDFITRHGFSPDAFVQMAFQAAYYSLYGRFESTYEPAMTKAFLHGRTEAIRTVQPASVAFTKAFCSGASTQDKISKLREACKKHTELTKECSKGLGQDRHLYALYSLLQREVRSENSSNSGSSASDSDEPFSPVNGKSPRIEIPSLFTDPGWSLLNTSILSTSNCGNPALRLFGFGPVAADGFGLGYIVKENGIAVVAASKHLQTKRFLDTLQAVFLETQRMIKQLYLEANRSTNSEQIDRPTERDRERIREVMLSGIATPGTMTPKIMEPEDEMEDPEDSLAGYGYFMLAEDGANLKRDRPRRVGLTLRMPE